MSISSIFNTVVKTARVIVIGLVLVSLCAAGANAAQRTYTESQESIQKIAKATATKLTEVGPDAPSETPCGNMAPSSRPTTEQQCVLQAVTSPSSSDRTGERLNNHSPLKSDIAILTGATFVATPVVSLAQVDPQTARILTLVGAVPSGTM